jgi:hypothetical protein
MEEQVFSRECLSKYQVYLMTYSFLDNPWNREQEGCDLVPTEMEEGGCESLVSVPHG